MPLQNNSEMDWNGYLIEGLAGCGAQLLHNLELQINARQLPKVTLSQFRVDMWWRPDSLCLDIISKIDGTVQCTIHAMDYGSALFVGVAYAAISRLGNYYKRMAAAAFLETVDRCLSDAIAATSANQQKGTPDVKTIGKVGKFGG